MIVLLYVLICITCFILVGLVLMQDSKSGLGGITGGATMNTFGGNTDKALVKATAVTATIFFILILISLLVNQKPKATSLIEMSDTVKVDNTMKESSTNTSEESELGPNTATEAIVPIPVEEKSSTGPIIENKTEGAEKTSTPKAEDKAEAPVEAPEETPAKEAETPN